MRPALIALVFVACAHAPPPELARARAAYAEAIEGPAATYATAELWAARSQLTLAEQEGCDAVSAADHAYVASRKLDIASSKARAALQQQRLAALTQQAEVLRTPVAPPPPPPPPVAAVARAAPPVEVVPPAVAPPDLPDLAKVADVRQESRGTVLTVPVSTLFAAGGAALDENGKPTLDAIAAALKKRQEHITLEVHTDNLGAPDENSQLSQQRAKAVRDYLVSKGVKAARIEARGLSDTRPLVDNDTPQNRTTNRRLEIVLEAMPVS